MTARSLVASHSPLIGIAGWKNSGKTTLVTRLVAELSGRGLDVATVKHAHHAFQIDDGDTDSARHRRAGASQVAIVSQARWAVVRELRNAPEPTLEVSRDERSIGRNSRNVTGARRMSEAPAHAGEDAGQWTDEAFDGIGHHRQSEAGKARWITIGIEHEAGNLRAEAFDQVRQHRPAGEIAQAFVAAAIDIGEHAARLATGKQNAGDIWDRCGHGAYLD